ncbi:TlpA disulfide reductase family protein [Pontibacterium sp.]|jgi:thiol-disulfide isomerase/thioredoxin|uniref:TlpA disulfide reductase family protein n=1 Tax=Pontibacterium sp. TaxID=2036026 RepID=UPI003566CF91
MKNKLLTLWFAFAVMFTASSGVSASNSVLYKLSFPNVENQEISLSEYKGKVVLLNFWATWCPPCVKEMPSMERLHQKFAGQDFEIVAISAGETQAAVESFMMELDTELTFPILLDEKGRTFNELGIRGLPMSFLFDRNGKLVRTISGSREWDEQREVKLIESVLKP